MCSIDIMIYSFYLKIKQRQTIDKCLAQFTINLKTGSSQTIVTSAQLGLESASHLENYAKQCLEKFSAVAEHVFSILRTFNRDVQGFH